MKVDKELPSLKPIHITISEERPQHFGMSGLFAYTAQTKVSEDRVLSELNADAEVLPYGKSYFEIVTFMSNTLFPAPEKGNVSKFAVYGNPQQLTRIHKDENVDASKQIVGYLDQKDLTAILDFMKANKLDTEEGVIEFSGRLDPEVREELEAITGDDYEGLMKQFLATESYPFFEAASQSERDVLLFHFG